MQSLRRFSLVALALSVSLLPSCFDKGDRLPETGATLEGTITYKGDKVPAAMVVVAGTGSPGMTGNVGEDGRYKVENVPLGEVKLAVITEAVKAQFFMAQGQYGGPDAKGKKRVAAKFVDVPAPYNDPESSGIKTTVNKGKNEYNIVLK